MSDNKKEFYTPQPGSIPQQGSEKLLHIIFIVDVSGCMRGEGRIEAVNDAFTQMIPMLQQIQMDYMSEFEIKFSLMTFDQDARWVVMPTPIMEYNHQYIYCSNWIANYSNAFKFLGEKLSRKEFMAHTGKIAAPIIMLFTARGPGYGDPYDAELDKLLDNGWFTHSLRYAIFIGPDALYSTRAKDLFSRFVNYPDEGIFNAVDSNEICLAFKELFRCFHPITIGPGTRIQGSEEDNQYEPEDYNSDDNDWEDISDGDFI